MLIMNKSMKIPAKLKIKNIKAIIFDCDGVLVNSESISCNSWIPVFRRKYGVELDTDFRPVIGKNFKDAVNYWFKEHGLKGDVYEIAKEKEAEYFRYGKGKVKAFPGNVEFIEKAINLEIKIAVASSGTPEKINFNLEESGLKRYFNTIVSCNDVKRGKPWPDLFLEAAKRMNLSPDNCLIIEDSLYGIQAAKKAGMFCIAMTTSFPAENFSEADMIVDNMMEIPLEEFI